MADQKQPYYFDNNATTKVDERVLNAMLPFFNDYYGNASSTTHVQGITARHAIEEARIKIAQLINAEENEIIYTSGATEAINIALKGVWENYSIYGKHIITVKTEHKAVLDTCLYLEKRGAEITYLNVDAEGLIDLDELKNEMRDTTSLVAIMHANNETGVIQPLEEISKIVHQYNCLFFTDATQSAGKLMIDVNELGVDLLCLSGHKMYGPKGVGALYFRRKKPRVQLAEFIHGGGHEKQIRSGTLNVPGIVALGKSCELAIQELWDNNTHVSKLRAYLEHQLLEIDGLRINGSTKYRLYNTSNICFPKKSAAELIGKWSPLFSISTGAACASGSKEISHVLKAMHLNDEDANSSLRFSFSKYNTMDEVKDAVSLILNIFLSRN
jgi:cysteine desulfurase